MQQKVDSGLYNNASEAVREALRLFKENDEVRRAKLKRLSAVLAKGEADVAAGRVTVLSDADDIEQFIAGL